jgi:branched-chain amino acid transport system ATP-binding protein
VTPMSRPLTLVIQDLHAWYGESKALHGVSFDVKRGEVVTLLGRNGAGKSTTLRSIMGLIRRMKGSIQFNGKEIAGKPPEFIGRCGLAYCPEERGIFASLSVEENLLLPPVIASGGMTVEEIMVLFPNLKERWDSTGGNLSGGEQQMLAIGRILRTGAQMLMLDEPTEGLAPVIVKQIGEAVNKLKARGLTILLVEQNFQFASRLADRHYVVEHGKIIDTLQASEVTRNVDRIQKYLTV